MNLEQSVLQVPIDDIIPNRFQPRLNFDEEGLEELSASIKEHGIIQPLVLRRSDDKYEIIAGERRYKAAKMAGLKEVPAVIANVDDDKSAELAVIENIQRKNLSPIEEARSYKNLLDQGNITQAELAKKMGLSQSAIANKLRLLNLCDEVQDALLDGKISERHARALLNLSPDDQVKWLNKILDERLTVRELDEAIKKENGSAEPQKEEPKEEEATPKEDDIPLVQAVDVDAIKEKATELPKIEGIDDIDAQIKEKESTNAYNPDVIPVDEASNNSKGSFFNFLEGETANMSTEETTIKVPVLDIDENKDEDTNIDVNTPTSNEELAAKMDESNKEEPEKPKEPELNKAEDLEPVSIDGEPIETIEETQTPPTIVNAPKTETKVMSGSSMSNEDLAQMMNQDNEEHKQFFTPITDEEEASQIKNPTNEFLKPTPKDNETIKPVPPVDTEDLKPVPPIEPEDVETPMPKEAIIEKANAPSEEPKKFFTADPNEEQAESIKPVPPINSSHPERTNTSNIDTSSDEDIFDPVDLIDTLAPDYVEKKVEAKGLDLKTAITTVRSMAKELNDKGFNITIDESDLDDTYQFIIKVPKK